MHMAWLPQVTLEKLIVHQSTNMALITYTYEMQTENKFPKRPSSTRDKVHIQSLHD